MKIITGIKAQAKQEFTLTLDDGSTVLIYLQFKPQQLGWFFDLTWGTEFTITSFRLVNSPNILKQFSNKIPFGLACLTQSNFEPTAITDLSDGSTTLYLLSAGDVAAVEAEVWA